MEKNVREREDQVARKFKADCADCSEVYSEKLIRSHNSCSFFILTSTKGNVRKEKR